jgi:hypothetical protein
MLQQQVSIPGHREMVGQHTNVVRLHQQLSKQSAAGAADPVKLISPAAQ